MGKYQGANSELQTRSAVIGSCQRFRLCLLYLSVPASIQVVTRLLQEPGLGALGSLGTGVWRHLWVWTLSSFLDVWEPMSRIDCAVDIRSDRSVFQDGWITLSMPELPTPQALRYMDLANTLILDILVVKTRVKMEPGGAQNLREKPSFMPIHDTAVALVSHIGADSVRGLV